METPRTAPQVRAVSFDSSEYRKAVELRRRVLRIPLGLDFTAEQLAAESADTHVAAFANAEVVGCLMLTGLDGHTVKMRQVAVDPSWQRSGVGRQLVRFAEALCRERNFAEVVLHARATAIPFYEHLGYLAEGPTFEQVTLPHRLMRKKL
jgi:ribosomal protein S18 acetylase RimI-like enzyme